MRNMNLHDLLVALEQRDIKLFLRDGKLNYNAPSGAMTAAIQRSLRENKEALIKNIQNYKPTNFTPEQLPAEKEWKATFPQFSLWKLCQNELMNIACNRTVAIRLKGDLSTKILIQSFEKIWLKQTALRTHFVIKNDELVQMQSDDLLLPFKQVKAYELPLLPMLPRDKISHINEPFDLQKGPLCDFTLIKLSARDHLLTLTLHQLITDGWSFGIILSELSRIYNCLLENKQSDLEISSGNYANCLSWQEQLRKKQWPELKNFWFNQLKGGAKVLTGSLERPLLKKSKSRISMLFFDVPNHLYEQLLCLSRQEELTLFTVLFSAFNVLLKPYLNQKDIVVATPAAIRDNLEFEKVVGCFINHVLLRNIQSDNQTFLQFLHAVNRSTIEAFNHKTMPYDYLLEEYGLNVGGVAPPITFALQNMPLGDIDFMGLDLESIDGGRIQSKLDLIQWGGHANLSLSCIMDVTPEGIMGCLRYDNSLFKTSSVAGMISDYMKILLSIVSSPETPIKQLWLNDTDTLCA